MGSPSRGAASSSRFTGKRFSHLVTNADAREHRRALPAITRLCGGQGARDRPVGLRALGVALRVELVERRWRAGRGRACRRRATPSSAGYIVAAHTSPGKQLAERSASSEGRSDRRGGVELGRVAGEVSSIWTIAAGERLAGTSSGIVVVRGPSSRPTCIEADVEQVALADADHRSRPSAATSP